MATALRGTVTLHSPGTTGGGSALYAKVKGSIALTPDMDPTEVVCGAVVRDNGGISDGTGLTLPAGVWIWGCAGAIEDFDPSTSAAVSLAVVASVPDLAFDVGHSGLFPGPGIFIHSDPIRLSLGDQVQSDGTLTLRAVVSTDAGTLDGTLRVGLWAVRIADAAADASTPMTFPGADKTADNNGNAVSGPLDLTTGQIVSITFDIDGATDMNGGYAGIYSPSLNSYGSSNPPDGYVTLSDQSGTFTFEVDGDAADWYVFLQAGSADYEAGMSGTGSYTVTGP